jgi:hypothetical protein
MTPDLRLTVRSDLVVRAVLWTPHLTSAGPLVTLLDARERAGVTIADVSLLHDDDGDPAGEAVVEIVCGGGAAAIGAITDWAALVGHRRLWLPHGVHDLEPVPRGRVETRCSGCRGRLVDGLPQFWEWVTRNGHFPTSCPLCGADLPQWRPAPARARRAAQLELVREAATGR